MTEQERFHFGYVCGDTGLIDEQAAEHQWFIENCCSITDLKKNWKTVCDKLNEVHEEKEYWKEKHLQEVERNSTISATIDNHNNWHDNKCVFLKQIKELKKENEQLKRFITSMGFTIEKENGTITRATKELYK